MSVGSGGPCCDVCGNIIFPWDIMYPFSVGGLDGKLDADEKCKAILDKIIETGGTWSDLPEGPLRMAWEKAKAKGELVG